MLTFRSLAGRSDRQARRYCSRLQRVRAPILHQLGVIFGFRTGAFDLAVTP